MAFFFSFQLAIAIPSDPYVTIVNRRPVVVFAALTWSVSSATVARTVNWSITCRKGAAPKTPWSTNHATVPNWRVVSAQYVRIYKDRLFACAPWTAPRRYRVSKPSAVRMEPVTGPSATCAWPPAASKSTWASLTKVLAPKTWLRKRPTATSRRPSRKLLAMSRRKQRRSIGNGVMSYLSATSAPKPVSTIIRNQSGGLRWRRCRWEVASAILAPMMEIASWYSTRFVCWESADVQMVSSRTPIANTVSVTSALSFFCCLFLLCLLIVGGVCFDAANVSSFGEESSCSSSPCLGGGTCQPLGVESFVCTCPPERTGSHCERHLSHSGISGY